MKAVAARVNSVIAAAYVLVKRERERTAASQGDDVTYDDVT